MEIKANLIAEDGRFTRGGSRYVKQATYSIKLPSDTINVKQRVNIHILSLDVRVKKFICDN